MSHARQPRCASARSIYLWWPAAACVVAALVQIVPGIATSADMTLPEVTVQEQRMQEKADGPVQGYRATRSGTFTKTDTPLMEVPASITVVPADLIKDQAAESLAEALRYVPGIMQHQGEGNRDQFILRGNSTTADFYLNGIRDDAQVFRDPYNLERIEVLKGPGGMIFGRGGAGGIINRVTRRPVFGPVASVSLTAGMFEHFRGTGDFGNKINDALAWRLNVVGDTSESFRDGVDFTRYAVNPTGTYAFSAQTALTLGYEHLFDERTADRGIPSRNGGPFDTPRSRFFGNSDQSHARSTFDTVSAVLNHDFGIVQLTNGFRFTHYNKYYQNVYPGSAVDNAGNLTLSAYNNANYRDNYFNQTDLTTKVNTGPIGHRLLVGLELGYQDSTSKRNTGFFGTSTSATVPASNPFAIATRFAPNGTDADNDVTATIVAGYVQDQITLLKQLKLLAGVRYDYFKVDLDDHRTTTPAVDLARTDHGVSPRAALLWTPLEAVAVYISYSYAFLPSGEQLGLATTTADLAPETARNYEIGARWDPWPALSLSAAMFRLNRDDVRVADPARPGLFIKTGQTRTDGVELGLQGTVTPFWQIFGGYAYLNAYITEPISSGTTATVAGIIPAGNKIGLVPHNMFALWNRFTLGAGWETGLGVIYQSGYFTSLNNTVHIPGFTRVDGAVYYTLPTFIGGGNARLAVNVENLFNKKYFPTVDGDNNISPGGPITAKLTLSATF